MVLLIGSDKLDMKIEPTKPKWRPFCWIGRSGKFDFYVGVYWLGWNL